jgi:hypothetical protein
MVIIIQLFIASIVENLNSGDSSAQQSNFLQAIVETFTALDLASVYGWFKINNDQSVTWNAINNNNTVTWANIGNDQSVTWNAINNNNTVTWVNIGNDQTPNWVPVNSEQY